MGFDAVAFESDHNSVHGNVVENDEIDDHGESKKIELPLVSFEETLLDGRQCPRLHGFSSLVSRLGYRIGDIGREQ